ncbi:hypothetical protein JF544_13510 [Halobacillus kuroshimensis]|uniref:Uncharacterized protein n=1 Tax=Halobacillus kuroshimensis TaxID=302481 RepID=A0ABS3DY34_9BACI|nr:hypothetical protein [Halobacillus kuroshimensis]MBN8236278.1 hypothetical protein [Halobacillus kuroshimensis]
MSSSRKSVERGQSITFRVPSDTPDHLLKQLSHLKETERRNFSSRIAQFVMDGVNESLSKDKETITVPLPKALSKEQRNWMKHEHSEALIGSILHQLIMDPVRATTLLASLNSRAYDIDEALYLQEETAASDEPQVPVIPDGEEAGEEVQEPVLDTTGDDDLDGLDLGHFQDDLRDAESSEETEEEDDDLLGDFLSRMNQ